MNRHKRQAIFVRLRAANPEPTTELHYSTPFELLIAVILSAQATDKGVNKATARLFHAANTPEAFLALGEDRLKTHIRTIGLFNSKAANIIRTCRILVEQHGGLVPADRKSLEALPGVGRKTANVVLNTAFGQPTMAVDTHIYRVANRTGIAQGKNPLAVEQRCCGWCRRSSCRTLITGSYYMGATCAPRASRSAGPVRSRICANSKISH